MKSNRKTAYEIRHDSSVENSSLWVSASDYFDVIIELQEMKENINKIENQNNLLTLELRGRIIELEERIK